MRTESFQADLLVIGGGIAGLMAAIRAAELGSKVIVAEKGNTKYSGAARSGNDHFWCYIPEVHGSDLDWFMKECMLTQLGQMFAGMGTAYTRTLLETSFDIVKLWDQWGIPMKHDGKFEFSGHSFPGRVMTHLKYHGRYQKPVLTDQALKRGAEIMDRVMIFDLLGDADGVTGAAGAVGIDTRTDRFVVFQAKTVLIGTGLVVRLYPNVTPSLPANNQRPFSTSGDGRAMAYRLGAELANMEMMVRHCGIKNYVRSGQGSWIGVARDPSGRPVGKYLTKPDRKYHDIIMEVDKQIFDRYAKSARGPVYMDCTGIPDDDLQYLNQALTNEGNLGLLEHLKKEKIDLRKNPVEFSTYEIKTTGRIQCNEWAETSVPGLYVAGDEVTVGISGAAVYGWIGGEYASKYARQATSPDPDKLKGQYEEKKKIVAVFQNRDVGPDWMEANVALNQAMSDYAGLVRSESMLEAGLRLLRRLKKKLHDTAIARDRWELTRCLEVVNLYDLGELVFVNALERKESRALHQRVDYPYTDPLLNNMVLIIKNVNGKPVTEWRDVAN